VEEWEGGTPEIYFSDPDGNRIQIQAPGILRWGGYLESGAQK